MEIKNTLTVQMGREWGITGERRGRVKPRNTNRGVMGMDSVRRLTVGVGLMGQGRAMGKKWDNCN